MTIQGLPKYWQDFTDNRGMNSGWAKDQRDGSADLKKNEEYDAWHQYVIKTLIQKARSPSTFHATIFIFFVQIIQKISTV